MKANINILFAAIFAVAALSSCSKVETIAPQATVSVAKASYVDVKCSIPQTKANSTSIKNEWNVNDWVCMNIAGKNNFASATKKGATANFQVADAANGSNGVAFAIYPKEAALTNGHAALSLAGQNGTIENLRKYDLLTSSANVSNSSVNFDFESHVSVIAINADNLLYSNTSVSKIVISGNGITSNISIDVVGSSLKVSAADSSDIILNNPVVSNGYIYVALLPVNGNINIDVYDNTTAHFFTTVDGSTLNAGKVSEIAPQSWDGGIAITFNPSVAAWDNVNC